MENLLRGPEGVSRPPGSLQREKVTSVKGNNYHYADRVELGQFAFQAREPGDYMACFWAADHKPPTTITVDLDWKSGVSAKDWSNVAKKGSLDTSSKNLMREAQIFLYANGNDHFPTAINLDKSLMTDLLLNQSPSNDVALASMRNTE